MAGNDGRDGGAGDDTLDGGAGYDYASYSNAPSAVRVNLALDDALFGAFTAGVPVTTANFLVGMTSEISTPEQHLSYQQSTGSEAARGRLFYDADGAGGAAAVMIARFDLVNGAGPALTAADFVIV